eukprot:11173721-Lingulodinium_polyedra.AAC.1
MVRALCGPRVILARKFCCRARRRAPPNPLCQRARNAPACRRGAGCHPPRLGRQGSPRRSP